MIRRQSSPQGPGLTRRLAGDTKGATLPEFGFVAPIFLLMLMGVLDLAHTQYTDSMIHGTMQRAARDLTLENAGSRQVDIDERVRKQLRNVVPGNATIEFEKLSHFDFSDIGMPEEVLGGNGDQKCDPGERYVDDNDNGTWDRDRGKGGIGGARDAVLYTVNVSYPRMFGIAGISGLSNEVRLSASTVLRNQPFDEQDRTAPTRDCPK